jgi:fructose/tagatose bisphosphate aldolase
MFENLKSLMAAASKYLIVTKDGIDGLKREAFVEEFVDDLAFNAVLNPDGDVRETARWLIWHAARECGVWSASINDFYFARGRGEYEGLTVPAVNLRGLTYDAAQAMFRVINKHQIGAFIFEIARSEIGYTAQRPAEYAAAVLAAAVKSGYEGPVCLQGDHFQFSAKTFKDTPEAELNNIRALALEAIEGGFYNIDIDASTLVDLQYPSVREQQKLNYEMTTLMTEFIRRHEPKGVTVSLGGEIGEVGGKNSTVEEMEVYMKDHLETLEKVDPKMTGISKISVQTGTAHGGVVLPDGSIAEVKIDFETLRRISEAAKKKFGIAGAVQHGASTLPKEAFDKFPETETCEIHLATGFQNIIYDHPTFPADLLGDVKGWIHEKLSGERKQSDSEEQFLYKSRKKAFGPFKKRMWELPTEIKAPIMADLENEFEVIFGKLNVFGTRKLARSKLIEVFVPRPKPLCMR